MKKICFFIHIPKTAGTSFRTALQQNQVVHMFYDYGKTNPASSPVFMNIDPLQLSAEHPIFHEGKYNFICGHVNYQQYAHCTTEENVISIVRNPIERIVSEYQHLKRHEGVVSSFEEFYLNDKQQNKQWEYMKGLKIENGALIGLTSHYKYFVECFSAKIGLVVDAVSVNNAPLADTEERLSIAPRHIRAAYELNKKDLSCFFKMASHFSESVKSLGYNTIPKDGAGWNCRIDGGKRVVGWFSCGEKDCFFIVIKVNNEKRVVISLDQYRQDIFKKGLSANPICGFNYPLSLLGAEHGDMVYVGILGASQFGRSLTVDVCQDETKNFE